MVLQNIKITKKEDCHQILFHKKTTISINISPIKEKIISNHVVLTKNPHYHNNIFTNVNLIPKKNYLKYFLKFYQLFYTNY